jgi:hypothetical protein
MRPIGRSIPGKEITVNIARAVQRARLRLIVPVLAAVFVFTVMLTAGAIG